MLENGLKLQLGMSFKQSERVQTEVRRLLRVQDYQKWFAVQPKFADSLWVRFQPAGIFWARRMWKFGVRMVRWWCFRVFGARPYAFVA